MTRMPLKLGSIIHDAASKAGQQHPCLKQYQVVGLELSIRQRVLVQKLPELTKDPNIFR